MVLIFEIVVYSLGFRINETGQGLYVTVLLPQVRTATWISCYTSRMQSLNSAN